MCFEHTCFPIKNTNPCQLLSYKEILIYQPRQGLSCCPMCLLVPRGWWVLLGPKLCSARPNGFIKSGRLFYGISFMVLYDITKWVCLIVCSVHSFSGMHCPGAFPQIVIGAFCFAFSSKHLIIVSDPRVKMNSTCFQVFGDFSRYVGFQFSFMMVWKRILVWFEFMKHHWDLFVVQNMFCLSRCTMCTWKEWICCC